VGAARSPLAGSRASRRRLTCKVACSRVDEYRQHDVLGQGKRMAIDHARATWSLLAAHGGRVLEASRGASAFVLELGGLQLAFVIEGLGTKSVLARQWQEVPGRVSAEDVEIADAAIGIVPAAWGPTLGEELCGIAREHRKLQAALPGWSRSAAGGGRAA
jgi:hypothetical protein